jgi:hypothetical protein
MLTEIKIKKEGGWASVVDGPGGGGLASGKKKWLDKEFCKVTGITRRKN